MPFGLRLNVQNAFLSALLHASGQSSASIASAPPAQRPKRNKINRSLYKQQARASCLTTLGGTSETKHAHRSNHDSTT